MRNFFYFHAMIKIPVNAAHSYILILFGNAGPANTRGLYDANSVYCITGVTRFKWKCVKHKHRHDLVNMYTSIDKMMHNIILDVTSFNINVSTDTIVLNLIEQFKYTIYLDQTKHLCKMIDVDYYDYMTKSISEKEYFLQCAVL